MSPAPEGHTERVKAGGRGLWLSSWDNILAMEVWITRKTDRSWEGHSGHIMLLEDLNYSSKKHIANDLEVYWVFFF